MSSIGGGRTMMRELRRDALPGIPILLALIAAELAAVGWLIRAATHGSAAGIVAAIVVIVIAGILLAGVFTVSPNQGRVIQLFGAYRGTAREPGLRWASPFYTKKAISLRVRNFETGKLKVNDKRSNPIEIASVVVWRVIDTAEAAFQVDNYENYVHVQSEAALRNLATGYPYDAHSEGEVT